MHFLLFFASLKRGVCSNSKCSAVGLAPRVDPVLLPCPCRSTLTHSLLSYIDTPHIALLMGSLCSKSSTHSGGHTVMPQTLGGSAPRGSTPGRPAPAGIPKSSSPNRLAATAPTAAHAGGARPGPRAAAAEAAERRQKEVRHAPSPAPRHPSSPCARSDDG